MMGKYDFMVYQNMEYGEFVDGKYISYKKPKPLNEYTVELPHSCDEWQITVGKPAEAIKELEEFIAEAQEAKQKLTDLVATDSQSQVEPLKSAINPPSDPKRKANT